MTTKTKEKKITMPTNGGKDAIEAGIPYNAFVTIRGNADLLLHRWNCDYVKEKAAAKKNSETKKTDTIENFVYRNDKGFICIPGEYLRQAIITAAKFRQDPRSPRKSAMDLYKASIIINENLCSLGSKKWDYEDTRRVVIQRQGINRTRPAFKVGWKISCSISVLMPEYISPSDLKDVLENAGKLVGIADFRPTFGRFQVVKFEVKK